jgi:hypothetical protein
MIKAGFYSGVRPFSVKNQLIYVAGEFGENT